MSSPAQLSLDRHCKPSVHSAHDPSSASIPQSIPVSSPFLMPSSHVGWASAGLSCVQWPDSSFMMPLSHKHWYYWSLVALQTPRPHGLLEQGPRTCTFWQRAPL